MGRYLKKILIPILFLFFGVGLIFPFSLYMPDDPELDELVMLYTRAGTVFPDASFPLSLADLADYAGRLQNKTDNRKIRGQIKIYIESLNFKKGRVLTNNSYSLKPAVFISGDTYIPDIDT
ncbi:MAG: hypothetical protein KAH95_10005, partial [Spirochaetales bacterium]|nr:hypothetical protein [Spirochaetales bacterium]